MSDIPSNQASQHNGDDDDDDWKDSGSASAMPSKSLAHHHHPTDESDGVMLDGDQPLHSTPVLVPLPMPTTPKSGSSIFSPSTDAFMIPRPDDDSAGVDENGMTSMLLPPATTSTAVGTSMSLNHNNTNSTSNGGGSISSSSSDFRNSGGGRSLLRIVDETSTSSFLSPRQQQLLPPQSSLHQHSTQSTAAAAATDNNGADIMASDSFLSTESSEVGDEDAQSRSLQASGRRPTELFMEQASMEVIPTISSTQEQEQHRSLSMRSSQSSTSSPHQGNGSLRNTALSISPSGRLGRRHSSDEKADVIILNNDPTRQQPESEDNGSKDNVRLSSASTSSYRRPPETYASLGASASFDGSSTLSPEPSSSFDSKSNSQRPSHLRSTSNGDDAIPTPKQLRQSLSSSQSQQSQLIANHQFNYLESPNGNWRKSARDRANSTGSLGGGSGRRRHHLVHYDPSDFLQVVEEPELIWELLKRVHVVKATDSAPHSVVGLLHWLFANWSSPPISESHVQDLWDHETAANGNKRIGGTTGLPEQPILHASNHRRPLALLCINAIVANNKSERSNGKTTVKSMSFESLDSPKQHKHQPQQETAQPLFWQLPTTLLKVFLRMLTRLITLESNEEYDSHVTGVNSKRRLLRESSQFLAPEHQGYSQRREPQRPDILYTVARLSATQKLAAKENETFVANADILLCILTLIERALVCLEGLAHYSKQYQDDPDSLVSEQQRHFTQVLPALIYLLGVWGVAGITPLVLRRWLALIASQSHATHGTAVPVIYREALVRALTFATHHASAVVPPRSFFSFQRRQQKLPALKRAIKGLPHWPFRNDFGVATWFRAEHSHHRSHLVSVRTDEGAGWAISLQPLSGSEAYTLAVSVFDNGNNTAAHQLTVSGCVLVPRNWYHVAIRHTRSRLKGVFSLSTRQQLVLLLDGKVMVNEALPFPRVEQSEIGSKLLSRATNSSQTHSRLNLEIESAVGLEGQIGSLYIFKENVADASFRALYEATGGREHRAMKRSDVHSSLFTTGPWDARHKEIVRKSKELDLSVKNDDADDIVLTSANGIAGKHQKPRFSPQYNATSSRTVNVIDFDDPDHEPTETASNIQQDLSPFGSKVFIVWDPSRTMKSMAFELHVGAHVNLDEHVDVWHSSNPQDVISSIGGVQALIPLFRSMIAVGVEGGELSILANLFNLLASFVLDHAENARELLRCGGIDVIEQLILASKRIGKHPKGLPSSSLPSSRSSLFTTLCSSEPMSFELVESLLVLRSASQHCVGLETKIFSRLLFNIPLWFGQSTSNGAALHLTLLPALSFLTKSNPEKVRECVGAHDMVHVLHELASAREQDNTTNAQTNRFLSDVEEDDEGFVPLFAAPLYPRERRHVRRIFLGMIFSVLSIGTSPRDLGTFLRLISVNSSNDAINGAEGEMEGGVSLRHQIQLELCTVLLFLLQLAPPVPGLFESFTHCCGNVQSGIGWILSVMAKAPDEKMVSLGIRSLFSYLQAVTKNDDQPVALNNQTSIAPEKEEQSVAVTTTEAATAAVALASSTVASLAKGVASTMGPAGRVSFFAPSRITPRIVFKLLWHLLKTHRLILGSEVRGALLYCMSDAPETLAETMLSSSFLLQKLIIHAEKADKSGCWFSYDVANSMLQKSGSIVGRSLQNRLVIATVLRLLRYLPPDTTQQWLEDILLLVKSSRKSIALVSSLEDWQSSLFHLVSHTVEELSAQQSNPTSEDEENKENDPETEASAAKRLDLCLELYSTLLGHLLRESGEQALDAVEHAASLQRVCLNGQVVLLLILSVLCADLFDHGTLLEVGSLTAEDWKDIDLEQDSLLLKQSAKLVTDAILSNGTEGLDMNDAIRSWRSLRHLAEVVVALVSKSGLGVVDLFAYNKHRASAIDSITGGLHGIRLPETRLHGVSSQQYTEMIDRSGVSMSPSAKTSEDARAEIDRRLCVTLAAQILTLMDAFIFPESLDTSLPASQVHGLALVRNSEPRLGAAQGPLIASSIKLSFLLMSSLEPCSVRMLQCVSRLRCLVQWALDLIRESSSREGAPPSPFQDKIASMDRLLLAVVLHCHRALGRCAALLSELESSSSEKYFGSRDAQKKHYRRLVRVALELRNVVSLTYRGRHNVIKSALSTEAVEELRSSLEGSASATHRSSQAAAAKDFLAAAREFLGSNWVARFQDVETRGELSIPEQVTMDTISLGDGDCSAPGILAVENLASESSVVQADFEKAIDSSFEGYLETQRKWTETENIRELEQEGDTSVKKLSEKYEVDVMDHLKEASIRRVGVDNRWNGIQRKAVMPWSGSFHFKMGNFPDPLGRRTLLVQNRAFASHKDAAYDSGTGPNSSEPSTSTKGESDLTDLIRRNAEAFTVEHAYSDDDTALQSSDDSLTDQESSNDEADSLASNESELVDELEHEEEWDKIDSEEIKHVDAHGDVDGWAKQAFIWSEHEVVVSRFEPVMLISLRSYVEGKVLLTSHGIYFKSTGNEINVMTKEPVEGTEIGSPEARDRRWRLSRLKEVHGRRYLLRPQAIELFFSDGCELLMNFPRGGKERDRFHAKLRNSCKVPMLWSPKSLNPRIVFRKSGLTELWRKRKISNFEYIMQLNRMAGRSFNDITQYPVFPWILSDYTSKSIDLKDSRVFRDLSKPIGALNPDRLSQLLERYKDLELFGFPEAERFLYGSHYSSPGIIIHYLIRQEPFTTMAIELQSGRFDCPDRLFFDVASSWEGCMTSSSDMKELVPEFFCLPEMFMNTNKFPLGQTQSGRVVDDVGLPPWANGSAHEFVRIQREALESEYVSQNLHHWVDLIFGYKQRGEEAEAAHNVFHHLSYENSVDLDKIADEVDRTAAESHIQNFGQTPSQLLQTLSHCERYSQEECWKPLIQTVRCATQLRSFTPPRQFGNANSEFAKGPVIKVFALSDSVLAVYGDMSVGSYRWFPHYKRDRLRMDKLRPLGRRELSTARDAMKRGSLVSPDALEQSDRFIGSSSLAITIGGRAREELRRNAVLPSSRLISSTEITVTSAEASALLIGCGFWDDTVKVHGCESLRIMASDNGGHSGPIHCLAVSHDGFLVTGGKDGTCRVWVVDHADMAIAISDGYVQTALGSPQDGDSLLSCCHVLWGHETPILCLDLDSDLDVVASGSQDGVVCIHTLRRGDFVRSFRPASIKEEGAASNNAALKIALGTTGLMVVYMADCGLHSFTVNAVKLASVDAGEKLNDMQIVSRDQMLVTGGEQGKVVIRQASDLVVCHEIDLSKHGPIRSVTATPDHLNPVQQFLFIGSDDGSLTFIEKDPKADTDET